MFEACQVRLVFISRRAQAVLKSRSKQRTLLQKVLLEMDTINVCEANLGCTGSLIQTFSKSQTEVPFV